MKIHLTKGVRIFVKNLETQEIFEVTDNLYFFEEEGIRDLTGGDRFARRWEIWIDLDI